MYATCKKQNQPIIGSNYLYIDCSLANPSEGEIFYSPDAQQQHHPVSMTNWRNDKEKYQGRGHPYFQISGGVVFFNFEINKQQKTQGKRKIPLPIPNSLGLLPGTNSVPQDQSLPSQIFQVGNDFSTLSLCFSAISLQADRTEEFAMTQYLFSLGHLHYILPTTYNCRLCYPEVASVLLNSSLIQGLDPKDSAVLESIARFNVSIWHPDRETKFWKSDPAQLLRSRPAPMLAPIQSKDDVIETWYQYAEEIEEIIGQQELATFCKGWKVWKARPK